MKFRFLARKHLPTGIFLLVFLCLGTYLFLYSHPAKPFSEEQLIRDTIWLDAWSLLFYLLVVVVWHAKLSWRAKASLYVGCFSIYGFVTVALLLNGTPFSLNSFWGDQQFRQAMILKFVSFFSPGDFYYKDLPPFYPPVYYFLLSVYARLFSVEAYKMLKIGGMLIYLLGPFLYFSCWRKLVSPFQAFFVTLATYLFCSINVYPLFSPHTFLGDSFFVPWWLYYIERVKNPEDNWRFYVSGGLIGAVLFSTYFYSFFIGSILLILRVTVLQGCKFIKKASHFDLKKAAGVLLYTALFSAPYWLPLLVSIASYGIDRARGGWHHLGSTGILFKYLEFSWPGLLFLGSFWYALRRVNTPLYKGLLLLIGSSIVYFFLGSVLGALDISINLIKARQFIVVTAGPFVGLSLAGVIRRQQIRKKHKSIAAVLASLLLLVFLHGFNVVAKQKTIKTARTSEVPTWNTDPEQMQQRKGMVFLTHNAVLPSFYPVYCFLAVNEHYSHPASRYIQRYNFLYLLQRIDDPYLFNLALQRNIYDRVDYFMPRSRDDYFEILASLSNYPNKSYLKTLKYSPHVVADNSLFRKEAGDHLYAVLGPSVLPAQKKYAFPGNSFDDSLLFLCRLRCLRNSLDSCGKELLDTYVATDWEPWHDLNVGRAQVDFGKAFSLVAAYAVETADSIHFLFAFQPRQDISADYKVFLHLYQAYQETVFDNFDFILDRCTSTWKKWDIILCYQSVPNYHGNIRIHVGFFRGSTRLGKGFWGSLSWNPQ
jgi:galactan 5-O-arabinofuranosyltransferase